RPETSMFPSVTTRLVPHYLISSAIQNDRHGKIPGLAPLNRGTNSWFLGIDFNLLPISSVRMQRESSSRSGLYCFGVKTEHANRNAFNRLATDVNNNAVHLS